MRHINQVNLIVSIFGTDFIKEKAIALVFKAIVCKRENVIHPSSRSELYFLGYEDCSVQNWRPLSTWSSGTTSRLPSKGKYVFASRPRRSSIEGRISRECISPPNLIQVNEPYLHYTTIPRKQLKHLQKQVQFDEI